MTLSSRLCVSLVPVVLLACGNDAFATRDATTDASGPIDGGASDGGHFVDASTDGARARETSVDAIVQDRPDSAISADATTFGDAGGTTVATWMPSRQPGLHRRPTGSGFFGWSVAASGDARQLFVGDREFAGGDIDENGTPCTPSEPCAGAGGVHSYRREQGAEFAQQQTLSGPRGSRTFGDGIALSPDARTLIVSDRGYYFGTETRRGAVHIFWRDNSSASFPNTPAQTILPPVGVLWFGRSVAYADGGRVLAVAASSFSDRLGGVLLFTRTNLGTFTTTPTQILRGPNGDPAAQNGTNDFGTSVALSNDGLLLVVGDQDYGSTQVEGSRNINGGIHVYVREDIASNFSNLPAETIWDLGTPAPRSSNGNDFGAGLALSQDGRRLLIGDPSLGHDVTDASYEGEVYVLARSARSQTFATSIHSRIQAPSRAISGFGTAVAWGADAREVFVAAPFVQYEPESTGPGLGGVWTYTHPAGF